MVFIAQTNGKNKQPNYRGLPTNYWISADEAIRIAQVVKESLKEMSVGYSPTITQSTQFVGVTYADGTSETMEVHGCRTEASAFYKVLNYHRNTLAVQKPIKALAVVEDKGLRQIY